MASLEKKSFMINDSEKYLLLHGDYELAFRFLPANGSKSFEKQNIIFHAGIRKLCRLYHLRALDNFKNSNRILKWLLVEYASSYIKLRI
jgi:hypothetical protein